MQDQRRATRDNYISQKVALLNSITPGSGDKFAQRAKDLKALDDQEKAELAAIDQSEKQDIDAVRAKYAQQRQAVRQKYQDQRKALK